MKSNLIQTSPQETGKMTNLLIKILVWPFKKIYHIITNLVINLYKLIVKLFRFIFFVSLFILSLPVLLVDIIIQVVNLFVKKDITFIEESTTNEYLNFYQKSVRNPVMFIFAVIIDMIKMIFTGIGNIFFWIYNLKFLSFLTKPLYKYVLQYVFNFVKKFVINPLLYVKNLITLEPYKKYYMKNKTDIHDVAHAYIYLSPALVLILIFLVYPLYNTFIMSFKVDLNYLTGEYKGIGLNYYLDIFKIDPRYVERYGGTFQAMWQNTRGFWRPFFNTFIIVFVSVPISVLISLLIAVALNSIKKLQGFFQTIFFLPYVTNVIAIGMVFSMLFNQKYGLINLVTGLDTNWMAPKADNLHILISLMIYTIWSALPFKIMVFLSGIQGIDKQYYQAAQVDATSKFRVFWRITVPLLSPFILYITITSCIGAFKAYASVIAMFGDKAGPTGNYGAAGTIVWYVYGFLNNYGTPGNIARASAGSVILFMIILAFTYVQMKVSRKRVHY
ncbi:sugar ABC transporter permease [Mycoplasmatota bacterium]|nr:sugar ABC transporter permease [Mycoplasmatota bacterium]